MQSDVSQHAKLVGVGGWLLLLILRFWFVAVRFSVAAVTQANHVAGLAIFVFAALMALAAYLLGIRNRKGVLLAKILLALEAAVYALASLVDSLTPASAGEAYKFSAFCVVTLLFFVYLFRSKRVKNTYFSSVAVPVPQQLL